ncbi:hypothetical protein SESBI_07276 [Sesbania bispinosa]|nr:hypothetical protein SESBI_07276 [Sesbania bispinosa]
MPQWTPEDLNRFKLALEETKYTVGLTFNSSKGYIYLGKGTTGRQNDTFI